MKLPEAKAQFIASWAALGPVWGISRTMASIHALLLTSADPMPVDDIMQHLQISRGNVSASARSLVEWNLIEKVAITGKRAEYYQAEKDPWKIARAIALQRKRRELDPLLKMIEQLGNVPGEFGEVVDGIGRVAGQAEKALNMMISGEQDGILKLLNKIML